MTETDLGWMMICGYLWKMCSALIMAFPSWLLVRYLMTAENVDYYDINTNFNPFMLSINEQEGSFTKPVSIEPALQ